jgi:hypothetical protein
MDKKPLAPLDGLKRHTALRLSAPLALSDGSIGRLGPIVASHVTSPGQRSRSRPSGRRHASDLRSDCTVIPPTARNDPPEAAKYSFCQRARRLGPLESARPLGHDIERQRRGIGDVEAFDPAGKIEPRHPRTCVSSLQHIEQPGARQEARGPQAPITPLPSNHRCVSPRSRGFDP